MDSHEESDWDEVLSLWQRVLTRTNGADIPPPSSAEDIRTAEDRLGVALPQQSKELYSLADGLPALGGDVHGVRGCAELMWFRDAEAGLIEIWEDIDRDGGYLTSHLDLMRAGLAVSKDGDEYRLFMVSAADDTDGWRLYRQSNGGDGVLLERGPLAGHLLYMANLYFEQ